MKNIAVLVEGQTEEQFVKRILFPYLVNKNICIEPITVTTSRTPERSYKGGTITFEKAMRDIKHLLNPKYQLVTTFFDFYGLEKSFFPDNFDSTLNPYEQIEILERFFAQNINDDKFLPYIQLHEFETFLFVDAEITANNLLNCPKRQIKEEVSYALAENENNPELVNNSPNTAPSKRIEQIHQSYQKPLEGNIVCNALGLDNMKNKCKHFKQWLEKLEQ